MFTGILTTKGPPKPSQCSLCYSVLHSVCSLSRAPKILLLNSNPSFGKAWGVP